jgi:Fe-S cluster assembly protein SufD
MRPVSAVDRAAEQIEMSHATVLKDRLLNRFEDLEKSLEGRGPDWLREARRNHAQRFADLGFPTVREEEWRNTNISPITGTAFGKPTSDVRSLPELPELARAEIADTRLVFVDGCYVPELSSTAALPDGVWVGPLSEALLSDPDRLKPFLTASGLASVPAFRAINAALATDGAVVWIPENRIVEGPIHLAYVSTGEGEGGEASASHLRTLVVAGRSSQATVVESYTGDDGKTYLTNAVTEVHVGPGATLRHRRLQDESDAGYHIATVESRQQANSDYDACNVNLGGRLVRNEIRGILDGEGGHCTLDGLCLTRDSQHLDNHTVLDHARPHCDSRELYKSILGGKSRAVFSGRIIVRPEAQKTDAKQSNPNLLLSADALAHTRPQLEIYADDVKCTHGATIGRLDEDSVFYLRSRGIDEQAARSLLVEAFAGEILDRIGIEPLQALLGTMVRRRLADF